MISVNLFEVSEINDQEKSKLRNEGRKRYDNTFFLVYTYTQSTLLIYSYNIKKIEFYNLKYKNNK